MPIPAGKLTVTEVAARLDRNPVTIYAWMRRGEGPPSYRLGGRRYFDESQFEQWLAEQRAGAA
jgi:excisionase family DNA binding protein